jgi:hypothetical protein
VSLQGGKRGLSFTDTDEYWQKPQDLRAMKRFECVICHCEKGWQKTKLHPTAFTQATEATVESPTLEKEKLAEAA